MQSKIKIIIPIRGPEGYNILDTNYKLLINEIKFLGNNNMFLHLIDNKEDLYKKIVRLNVSILNKSSNFSNEGINIEWISKKFKFFKSQWAYDFLILNIELLYKPDSYLEISIDDILRRFSLILQLTYNTKIDFLNGVIFNDPFDNILVGKTEIIMSDVDLAYEHALRINWPIIKQPTINQTLNWFKTHNVHTDDLSQSKLHRAINAFSYSFSNLLEKDTSQLFWTMLGIESLLAEGNNNITSQIKTKTSLILDEPKEFKRKLTKLYDYRSRLVHGEINFPPKYSSDFDKFEEEYWDYSQFALSILIALIKELIIENKNEFKFEYSRIK